VPAGTSWVPTGYQLVPAGTSWSPAGNYQLVPVGSQLLMPTSTGRYKRGFGQRGFCQRGPHLQKKLCINPLCITPSGMAVGTCGSLACSSSVIFLQAERIRQEVVPLRCNKGRRSQAKGFHFRPSASGSGKELPQASRRLQPWTVPSPGLILGRPKGFYGIPRGGDQHSLHIGSNVARRLRSSG
jgi:hypothetical protein